MNIYHVITMVALSMATMLATTSTAAAQERGEVRKQDTGTITLVFDGKEETATAVAYVVKGRLYIRGIWVDDPAARYGPASLASAYTLRVPNSVGEHPVVSDGTGDALFSTLYSTAVAGKAYSIYRSDEQGGTGAVTIYSITDQSVRGAFSLTAYNADNPAEKKIVSGKFDVKYRTLFE